MVYLLIVPATYLIGSIPWGYIAGRLKGVDVRQYGSGKVGMTNVLRTVGGKAAALVLLGDVLKGFIAVLLARLVSDSPVADAVAGVLVIAGHIWPVFLGFRGGRGISTGFGTLMLVFPVAAVVVGSVFILVVLISRYVSLGSVSAASAVIVVVPIIALASGAPMAHLAYGLLGAALVLVQHRDNVKRLLDGTERRLGQPAEHNSQRNAGAR